MAFDEGLAQRVREALAQRSDISEKKMFGGLAFLLGGHMCVGINGDELMVRVGPDAHADALSHPQAREMDFTGRSLKGFVYVRAEGLTDDADLADWTGRGVAFAAGLPPK